ncbi:hypothetical protein KR018_001322 [Drosophila ironensis]|nr:hypothetical protein KR018_001322 [Drosophila ironensis]
MDQSKQAMRDYCPDGNGTCTSSLREVTLIETVTSFLEEHGAAEIDRRVLRKLAEALSKSIDDTSPGALQDVTMENSYNSFDPMRQGDTHSPMYMQGRSVRELEEQMSTLRKENFNLKLRIYFMEEGQPGGRAHNNLDPIAKQLIDAKIEVEVLRKTVEEKTELLKDAARAISHHEDLQRSAELQSQQLIEQLQEEVRHYQVGTLAQPRIPIHPYEAERIKRLESEVQRLEDEVTESDLRRTAATDELQFKLAERQEVLDACEAKIQELVIKNAELVERLQRDSVANEVSNETLKWLRTEIEESRADRMRLVESVHASELQLERQNSAMKDASDTMNVQRKALILLEVSLLSHNNQYSTLFKHTKKTCLKDNMKHKDAIYCRMLKNVVDIEAIIAKQNRDLDSLRQESQYYRELSERMQQKMHLHHMERVAIVQPMPIGTDGGVGNSHSTYNFDRTGSSTSLHSNFSSISVWCGNPRDPGRASPRQLNASGQVNHGLVQLFLAKLVWVPTVPVAMGQCALTLAYLWARLQTCLLSSGTPINNAGYGEASSIRIKHELGAQLADKLCELQEAQEKLKERERIHEQACRTIQKLMQKLSSQDKEIKRLNQQHEQSANKENDASNSVVSPTTTGRSVSDNEACSPDLSSSLKERYERKIAEQEELIKQLKLEVKKKTANLQSLVNKELWEKNREVERLTKLLAGQQKSLPQTGDESAGEAVADLQQSFTESDYLRAVERNKLLQRKVDVLFTRLTEDQQNSAVIGQLRVDLKKAHADVESADKWRLECADVCGVLTNRLEELAGFLNSLLKHKDVLGVLAADRRHAMRKAVDRSLDLSKSLNMTLNITGASLADQSLSQLCNISEMLYTEGDLSHKTFNSHEEIHAASTMGPTMENLRAENKALKRELEKRRSNDGQQQQGQQQQRKERRSLPLPSQQLDNHSESEAWSEPDRKVSLARIGLEENSNSLAAPEQPASESESEGRACSARQERSRINNERIAQLEEQLAQKDERMLNVQCQLVESDNRYKQEQLRCLEISQHLEQLRAINEALTADLQAIGSHEDQRMVELQQLLELRNQQIDQLKLAQSTLTADAQITEMELQAAQQRVQDMERKYAESLDQIQATLEQFKLDSVKQLEEHERLHQEALERDWVALSTYQDQATQLIELQRSLDYHQENEKELKQTLVENELATRALKKQLDESTLQASKAVMERTKAYNDKLQLEKRTEELKQQLEVLKEEQRKLQQQQKRGNSSDVSQSGYTSEEVAVPMGSGANGGGGQAAAAAAASNPATAAVVAQRLNNSSPDLGIESDAGRISSVELSNAQRALLKTVELKSEPKTEENSSPEGKGTVTATVHDCAKVDLENAELRRKLTRTKRAFEDTYEKLRLANKAKAQVEKDIKNQILKTHNVLRNVRSNMENEL